MMLAVQAAGDPKMPGAGGLVNNETLASQLKSTPISAVWAVAAVVVAICTSATKDEIDLLLEDRASFLAFWAGYTLPLTAAFAILGFLFLRGEHKGKSVHIVALTTAGTLFACGKAAEYLGLGLLPEYRGVAPGAPPQLLAWVLGAYLNSYGWPLVISALALGAALAVWLARQDV